MKDLRWMIPTLVVMVAAGCGEQTPASTDGDRLVIEPRTVELVLPWSVFGGDVEVYGGFGSPDDLSRSVVANDYEGGLESRTIVEFGDYPSFVTVRDTAGVNVVDTLLTFTGGRVVVAFDTLSSTNEGPVDLSIHRIEERWHSSTASWEFAVDTIGDRQPWSAPGGGSGSLLANATWDPAAGDSIVFELDSIQIAEIGDTTGLRTGVRIDLDSPGHRLEVRTTRIRLDTRPSVNPDSTFVLTTLVPKRTFIYQPQAPPPPDGIRVGGAPAWRTVLSFDIPKVLNGPTEVCDLVGCPFTLDPTRVNTASLLLYTTRVDPPAFQPSDTVRMDVRPVLAPERLPKSPLGGSFLGILGRSVSPTAFSTDESEEIGIPVTAFVRTLLGDAEPPTRPVALLSILEPLSISYATFAGPGSDNEPRLRLIVTVADTVEVR